VLVMGATGPVGQIAVQAARELGARRVVAAGRSRAALERVAELGADATVTIEPDEPPAELSERLRDAAGGELQLAIDALWGRPAEAALSALDPGGRLVNVGQSAGAEAKFTSGVVRGGIREIRGHSNMLAPRELKAEAYARLVELVTSGRILVDRDELTLDDVAEAWRRQAESPHRKLVVHPAASV